MLQKLFGVTGDGTQGPTYAGPAVLPLSYPPSPSVNCYIESPAPGLAGAGH